MRFIFALWSRTNRPMQGNPDSEVQENFACGIQNPGLWNQDTRLIRTLHYYGQFSLSLGKALAFSLNSTRLIRTPHYYRQFALSLGKESSYIFSKFNPLNTDTRQCKQRTLDSYPINEFS